MPLGLDREELTQEELALAYELAVSSLKTSEIATKLAANYSYLTPERKTKLTRTVSELRTPDDEIIVGDRVKFTDRIYGEQTGEVVIADRIGAILCLVVNTNNGDFYIRGSRCIFAE